MIPGERAQGHSRLTVKEVEGEGFTPEEAQRVRMIVGLHTDRGYRRKGDATRLMKQVCGEADEDGTLLLLEPKPDDDAEFDEFLLQNFYRRFGFTRVQKAPVVLMARKGR